MDDADCIDPKPTAANVPTEAKSATLTPIYFLSGLGTDRRVFQWLSYEGYRPVHIPWLVPERGEALAHYAKRMASSIREEQPVLVGLSFGGMVAIEIAKQIKAQKVILISSVKITSEVPFYFKMFRLFPLHRIFPFKPLLWALYWLAYWLFAPEGNDERVLFKNILQETDSHFLKWALHQVVIWHNQEIPEHLVHIHGRRDRIFPYRFVSPDYTLENSGHLMVMNRAKEISSLIEKLALDAASD
jgi:pimeloyl-ACP methyl ester carboxylesterase